MKTVVSDFLSPLASNRNQAYLSNALQVADLLKWTLEQVGPADVHITSFSVSEEFLRRLFFIRKERLIRSLDIVLDFKATHKTLVLWPFIAQTVGHCYLADNHSKLMLVSNERWKVAAVMSQNLTRGNRFESGFVSTDHDIYDALYLQLQDLITHNSVPFHEIYSRTVGDH